MQLFPFNPANFSSSSFWKKNKKKPFSLVIVSKCAHHPAVCYSAVGLTSHVSQLYNGVPRPRTIVWMVGVKGQPPP